MTPSPANAVEFASLRCLADALKIYLSRHSSEQDGRAGSSACPPVILNIAYEYALSSLMADLGRVA